jgi:hypothetical protein
MQITNSSLSVTLGKGVVKIAYSHDKNQAHKVRLEQEQVIIQSMTNTCDGGYTAYNHQCTIVAVCEQLDQPTTKSIATMR